MINFLKNLNLGFIKVKMLFEYFFGNQTIFFVLFLLSAIVIFFSVKDKKIKNFFTIYIVFILFVIWNPVCINILEKMINFGSMYRIYYMLPLQFTIAIALTILVSKIKFKALKLISVIVACVMIVFMGDCVFNEWNTIKTNNLYKLPDESVAVAEAIMNDDKHQIKRAIVPYGMSSRIQQVYSEIYLPYTRIVYNIEIKDGLASTSDTDNASSHPPVKAINTGDVAFLEKYSKDENLNYIVFHKATVLTASMDTIGFEKYQETEEHVIYRKIITRK